MKPTPTTIGVAVAALAVVAASIFALQNFDAGKVKCEVIPQARAELQSLYDSGVAASVEAFAEQKAAAEARLSQCINAEPVDPCADLQAARDSAVEGFNSIPSPADSAPYAEFKEYFAKHDDAYSKYKSAKETLDQCRAANPPKPVVPYEESDTKACFDAYDAEVETIQSTFTKNTQTLRSALQSALTTLDLREKACNPPKGRDKFTDPIREDGETTDGTPIDLASCRLINAEFDYKLSQLRQRASALPTEIESVEESIKNVQKRMGGLRGDLSEADTYIPPESTKTQFEGALNALRAERKVAIEAALEFYQKLLERKQKEKADLEQELKDVQAQINARIAEIEAENARRQREFPTALHQSKPDKCAYYHCHGVLCGMPDPASDECGHGATTESDISCKEFLDAYLSQ
jgi:hypothetical protein